MSEKMDYVVGELERSKENEGLESSFPNIEFIKEDLTKVFI